MALSRPQAEPSRRRRSMHWRLLAGGTDGNEQLTAVTGVVLLLFFAVIGITILRIGQLLWLHLFIGVVLVGPVLLKLMSTGYRFTRYYSGAPAYRRKGPPHPALRLLGPVVVLTTLAVLFTGLVLLLDGPGSSGLLRLLHKLSFIAWLGAIGLHVLGHLAELPGSLKAVSRTDGRHRLPAGSTGRTAVLVGATVAGLVLALLFLPDIHSWTAAGHSGFRPAHGQ